MPPISANNSCQLCGGHQNNVTQICDQCLKHPPKWDQALSVYEFKDKARELILRFKYSKHLYLTEFLSQELQKHYKEQLSDSPDIITFVPMHPLKKLFRGYNQAEILAEELAKSFPESAFKKLLKRKKYGKAQASKIRSERLRSSKNLFSINRGEILKGKSILLIDDILTTGATLNACAFELKKAQAERVTVLTLARG